MAEGEPKKIEVIEEPAPAQQTEDATDWNKIVDEEGVTAATQRSLARCILNRLITTGPTIDDADTFSARCALDPEMD